MQVYIKLYIYRYIYEYNELLLCIIYMPKGKVMIKDKLGSKLNGELFFRQKRCVFY